MARFKSFASAENDVRNFVISVLRGKEGLSSNGA